MRAVTRELGIAATPIYLPFSDRDALILACLRRCHDDLLRAVGQAEAAGDDPVAALRARTLVLGAWARRHPGLYEVLHESTLDQRADMSFKQSRRRLRRGRQPATRTPGWRLQPGVR
jgi:AcrR family transcriptional regulator